MSTLYFLPVPVTAQTGRSVNDAFKSCAVRPKQTRFSNCPYNSNVKSVNSAAISLCTMFAFLLQENFQTVTVEYTLGSIDGTNTHKKVHVKVFSLTDICRRMR